MEKGHHNYHDSEEFDARIKASGVSEPVSTYLSRCAKFHSSPAPGLLIGAFMMDYALELLGAHPDEKLFAVCETPKCLPDAPQVIAHITTGNGRLTVLPIGRFAITVNRASDKPIADAVRVYIDLEKIKQVPVIESWFSNSPSFNKHTMGIALQEEIFRNGRKLLSYEHVRVPVKFKESWKPVTCPSCRETVPDYMVVDGKCGACGPMKYYEKLP
ncbi:MAG: formylmethanofuran dehydrogenase subunit E family protein [Methanoregula sp.]|uniref:FmdE family protein n=1 Tax=Methanoregula sp. TaxID=2052170 RepID=UPI003C152FD6